MVGISYDPSMELVPGIDRSVVSHGSHLSQSSGVTEMEGEEFECNVNLIRKEITTKSVFCVSNQARHYTSMDE